MRLRSYLLDTYVHVCVPACLRAHCVGTYRPSDVNYQVPELTIPRAAEVAGTP